MLAETHPDVSQGAYDQLIKVIIIGVQGCGKTSLMVRFIDNYFGDGYIATIGVDFKMKTVQMGHELVRL